jgi:hypothetical protein
MRMIGVWLILFTLLSVTQALAAPVESLWGGIWHKTTADGSQVDCLDAGLNSETQDLSGMTFSVSGPNGFSYSFDKTADLEVNAGYPEVYKELSSLPSGVYTFTLNDGNGHISAVTDTHVSAAALPRVDSSTIRVMRTSYNTYRFSWAPVNEARTYYYRLVIALDDAKNSGVYYGTRGMQTSAEVGAAALTEGTRYKVRVEVHDAPSFTLLSNRSDSAFIDFTPNGAADYKPERVGVEYSVVYNRFESTGAVSTDLSLGLDTLEGVTAASVSGPGGFNYSFDLAADRDPTWPELYKNVPSTLPPGRYTFSYLANGIQQYAFATLTAPVGYPAPDPATYQAEDLETSVRFSWGDVDHTGALYYRVYLKDPVTEQYIVSARVNRTYLDIPTSDYAFLSTPQWRVEVMDSSSIATQRNRVIGPWRTLAVQEGSGKPQLYSSLANATNYNGAAITDLWVDASSGTVASMHLDGPNGYSRDLSVPGGYLDFLEPVTLAPGLYRFTATSTTGKSTTRFNYHTAPHPIPAVDYKTVRVNDDGYGISINWAPVVSDLPVWYGVEFSYVGDGTPVPALQNIPYYFARTSLLLNYADLPTAPFMFRIYAFDGTNGSTYNNYSRSVMVGYSGPGYDYRSLTDADDDGFASNVDVDDNDGEVNPFPYPAVTSFQLAAASTALSVPVTSFTTTGTIAAWCLTEQNSSASCNWQSSPPAQYTFSSAGTKTLYAFVRGSSGNISAGRSAQVTIASSFPLTLSFSGDGAGSVTGGMNCSTAGNCPAAPFLPGDQVSLKAVPGIDALFTGWSGDCSAAGDTCTVNMSAPRSVTAAFAVLPPVWVGPYTTAASYFRTVTDAYRSVATGAKIKMKAVTLTENVTIDRAVAVTLQGGYGSGFAGNAGKRSVLKGALKIRKGAVVVEGVAVR